MVLVARPPFADVLLALKEGTIPVCSVDIPSGEIKQISFLSDVNPFFSEFTEYEHRPQYIGTPKCTIHEIYNLCFVIKLCIYGVFIYCIIIIIITIIVIIINHSLCWCSFCASARCKPCT